MNIRAVVLAITLGVIACFGGDELRAQGAPPVTTYNGPAAPSTNASAAISSGGTFQSVFAQNSARKACFVQNNGTHNMWVSFGAIASATHNNSVVIVPGQAIGCFAGAITLTDQVSIDGTTSDVFTALQQ
jgi:hypothetical protein